MILLQQLIIVLIALTFHETAHGWMANRLGDTTARDRGRLSLDPRKHLDPIGFICMLLFGFGWANPVPVDARKFKNPKLGMALTALAGPVANLLLAFMILLPLEIMAALLDNGVIVIGSQFGVNLVYGIIDFVSAFHYSNITLALFNLFPVPPLDGSRVLYAVLPDRWYFGVMKYERVISIVILFLLVLDVFNSPLAWLSSKISGGMLWLWQLLPWF
ncbi:MAG: site-2 protease family protein [Clostridia bacterium]|nr:site-2 protease family protein [Clostridia bacterium]